MAQIYKITHGDKSDRQFTLNYHHKNFSTVIILHVIISSERQWQRGLSIIIFVFDISI